MSTEDQIITTKDKIEEVMKFAIVTAFRYCILNKLDFSISVEEDEEVVANKLYEEMFGDENKPESIKNKYTKMFNEAVV